MALHTAVLGNRVVLGQTQGSAKTLALLALILGPIICLLFFGATSGHTQGLFQS